MDVHKDELAARLAAMSDEELLNLLRTRDLTPLALQVATSILNSRGLASPTSPSPSPAEVSEAPEDDSDAQDVDLVTVAEAPNAVEANVIRLFLESHGLFASVWGEHTPVSPWAYLPGRLPRVQVRSDQAAEARALLAAMRSGDEPPYQPTDLEVTQEVLSTPASQPRGNGAPLPSRALSSSATTVSLPTPAWRIFLIRILIFAVVALLTVGFWMTQTH